MLKKILTISSRQLILAYAVISVLLFNSVFLKNLHIAEVGWLNIIGSAILLYCMEVIVYSILFVKYITKPLLFLLLIGNTIVLYFMSGYNAAIDKIMIINAIQTDKGEVGELLQWNMLPYGILLILALLWLIKVKITYQSLRLEIKARIIMILSAGIIGGIIFGTNFKKIADFMDENKELRYYIVPSNYIGSVVSVAKIMIKAPDKVKILTKDIEQIPYWKDTNRKNLFIMIVGETARAYSFSLSGYTRNTNEPLNKYRQDMIVYDKMYSCGTSTAVSVPCIFSPYPRKQFTQKLTSYSENILDVFEKSGYDVIWKDANSGCKGVCNRVKTQIYCEYGSCMDIEMHQNFAQEVKASGKNMLVVFHQRGSHGPLYYKRYPAEFEKYTPVCRSANFKDCTQEELTNAYDNTIYYTSYVIADLIKEVKPLEKDYNIVLLYTSDHGETLGEGGKFLHGAPYENAPAKQKEVPFFIWMPKSTVENMNYDWKCLQSHQKDEISHDNLFHSLLGLGGLKIEDYDKGLDIFTRCCKK